MHNFGSMAEKKTFKILLKTTGFENNLGQMIIESPSTKIDEIDLILSMLRAVRDKA